MIALSQAEKTAYKTALEVSKRLPRDRNRRDDSIDPEDLKLLRKLWQKGKPFFITGVVNAPYDGCWHEPNIWLVTPSGCDECRDLNDRSWKPRYADPHGRTKALVAKSETISEVWRWRWKIERELAPHIEVFGRDWKALKVENPDGKKSGAQMQEELLELDMLREMLSFIEEVEPELQAHDAALQAEIDAKFPRLPDDPDAIVWPLYASGQGVAVDVIRGFSELVGWVVEGVLPTDDGHYRRSRWDGSSFAQSGSFDSFTVRPWGPVSAFAPDEHYWAASVRAAEDKYGLELPWCCEKCNKEQEGVGESGAPHYTGYRGNGGIGVFMEGALCDDCFQAGICRVCDQHGGDDYERYSSEVADYGLTLCEWHAAELTKACLRGTPEAINYIDGLPRDRVVEITPYLANAGAGVLPGFEPEPVWDYRLVLREESQSRPIQGVTVDVAALEAWIDSEGALTAEDMCWHRHRVVEQGGMRYLEVDACYGITMLAGDIKVVEV